MHVAYLGNFEPEHSTENEVRRALENNGHIVAEFQEGNGDRLRDLSEVIPTGAVEMVLWTRTKGLADKVGPMPYWRMIAAAHRKNIPVVGYHLDRWWGLARQADIATDPFFRVDLLCTADGGHDQQWEDAGVMHAWFPPAISERNCYLGTPREEYRSEIAFVGSWRGGYHEEDTHRPALIKWLKDNYSNRVTFWPKDGHAIRGPALNDLYASTKVVVGTSCLVPLANGQPVTNYCSDRIPETLGRGGILVHPSVKGIDELYGSQIPYDMGDFDDLGNTIEDLLIADDRPDGTGWVVEGGRDGYRQKSVDFTRQHHTYEGRMQNLIQLLNDKGML